MPKSRQKQNESRNHKTTEQRGAAVNISYNKLWKLLVDKKMSKADLRRATKLAPNTMTNLRRDKYVSLEVLVRICEVLDCDIGDIVGVCRDDARSCDGLVVRVYVDMADAVLPFCYSACCKPYSQKYSELSLDESDRSYSGAVCGAFIQIYNMEKPRH